MPYIYKSGLQFGATETEFAGTDGVVAGSSGLVPAPTASDRNKFLKSDGTWAVPTGASGGTSDYEELINLPRINNVSLLGDVTLLQLGLVDFFYPIGSYYDTSNVNFNPNTLWGGTWTSTNLFSQDTYTIKDVFASNVTASPAVYTATDTGLLVVTLVASTRVYCAIIINGTSFTDVAYPPGTGGTFIGAPIIIPVKKNDVVQINNINADCYVMASRTKLLAYEIIGKRWLRTA